MKLIIFDLDQTLVDFLSVHDEVTRRLLKEFFNVAARLTGIDFICTMRPVIIAYGTNICSKSPKLIKGSRESAR